VAELAKPPLKVEAKAPWRKLGAEQQARAGGEDEGDELGEASGRFASTLSEISLGRNLMDASRPGSNPGWKRRQSWWRLVVRGRIELPT
jgi:hypothetical protein